MKFSESKLSKTVMLLKVKPCMTTYLFFFTVIQFSEMFLLSHRWSYGVVLYEIFTIGNASNTVIVLDSVSLGSNREGLPPTTFCFMINFPS